MQNTYYVAADFGSSGGSDYYCPAGGRGYVSNSPNDKDYFIPNLLGGSIEWDVDLSQHECGCIAAFYMVKMPGVNSSGQTWWETDGWGYCDANQVAGNWCPELDLFEANKYSF